MLQQTILTPKVVCELAVFTSESSPCGLQVVEHDASADQDLSRKNGVMAVQYDAPIEAVLEAYYSDRVTHIDLMTDSQATIDLSRSIVSCYLADGGGQLWLLQTPSPGHPSDPLMVFAQALPVYYKPRPVSVAMDW